jgi:hypothetical protein
MAAADIPKTAIITPFGLWEFVRMPFGLKNAAQAFQRLMAGVLRGLPFVFVYLDNILIASSGPDEHEEHLRHVLRLLRDNGLVLNKAKSVLGVVELDYLGHRVSAAGITPLPSRVDAVVALPATTSKVELQRFLGIVNFYHRFCPVLASRLRPLHAAVTAAKKPADFAWSSECDSAFVAAKRALADAVLLDHPNLSAPTRVTTDASGYAVGAELAQFTAGLWRPVAYFSKKMSNAEKKYSAFDRELLGIYLAIKSFRHHLEGRPFHVLTDHKPLTTALRSAAERSPRQTGHLAYIAEFTADLRHVPGQSNVVADALSRSVGAPPVEQPQPPAAVAVIGWTTLPWREIKPPAPRSLRTVRRCLRL